MAETLTNGTTQTDTTSAADKAVAASNEAKAAADKAAADKTAASIAAAKPDFAAEEARIAALPEAERAAATEKLAADKKAADTIATGSKVVPEKEIKYDLKLPAGSTLGAAFVERTAAIARGLGLDQSGAEKLLSARAEEYDTTVKALTPPDKDGKNAGPLWIAREEGFRTEAFKDKAFGNGDQKTFDIAVEKAQHGLKVLDRTGTLGALLKETGYGSHPAVLAALADLGRRSGEAGQIMGSRDGAGRVKSEAERMYPHMYNDDGSPKQ